MNKTLFEQSDVAETIQRIEALTASHQRLWGKMNATQMLAHCNASMETAMGKTFMKRLFIGRLIGSLIRPLALGPKPFGKNSPTDRSYIFTHRTDLDFAAEKSRLLQLVREFFEGGPTACTRHPHPFFGGFRPEQWGLFQWKHLDHHLRQFGV